MSSDAPDVVILDVSDYYYEYKLAVYNLLVGSVFGVYIVFYVTSVHVLLSKPGFTSSWPRVLMFGITTFMFVSGVIALVLKTILGFQQVQSILPVAGNLWSSYRFYVVTVVVWTITRLMYILSDIICAWRAVVLWNRDKRVIAILLLCIIGTTAAAGWNLALGSILLFSPSHWDPDESDVKAGERVLTRVGPTLGTNLLSTGLIAWKAWKHRISVREHLGEGSGSARVTKVFALLIESGFIYCCLWIVHLTSAFNVIPPPGFDVMDSVLLLASGLYPTLIIVLVGMQMSPVEYYSTFSTRTRFANGPAPRADGMPEHVYMICREPASDSDTQVSFPVFRRSSDEEKSL